MARLENEVVTVVAAFVTGDLDAVAEDHDLVDETLHPDVAIAVAGRNRIVVVVIANQRLRRDLGRDFLTRFEWSRRQVPESRFIGNETFADRQPFALPAEPDNVQTAARSTPQSMRPAGPASGS